MCGGRKTERQAGRQEGRQAGWFQFVVIETNLNEINMILIEIKTKVLKEVNYHLQWPAIKKSTAYDSTPSNETQSMRPYLP